MGADTAQADGVRVDGASKRFGDLEALAPTDLTVHRGEVVTLIGPSGCGKTTLLRMIAGLDLNRSASRSSATDPIPLLERVGLGEFRDSYPHELSGGMLQRVGLVRAFALGADYLLMDEPFAALDEITRADMRHLLAELSEPTGAGVVFVTHSLAEAVFLSDRVVVMSPRPGRVVGTVAVDLPHPRLPEVEDTPEFFALETEVRAMLLSGAGR